MSSDLGNVEQLSFSNGVRATRERLPYCPLHGMDGNDGRCRTTQYTLYGFQEGAILARVVRCYRDGSGAAEEQVPVHNIGHVVVNHDPNTLNIYHGRLDHGAGAAMSVCLQPGNATIVQADTITGDVTPASDGVPRASGVGRVEAASRAGRTVPDVRE